MNAQADQAIKNIVIVGGGAIGWSAAVGLARGLQGQRCNISVIELAIQQAPLIAASPHIFDYHKIFGIQEKALLQSGFAKLALSQGFKDFDENQSMLFNGFETSLPEFCSIELQHVFNWLNVSDFNQYSVATLASKLKRLALPKSGNDPIQANFTCGMHINSQVYEKFMRGAAKKLGVIRLTANITEIQLNQENGFIQALMLSDGSHLTTDLVIDNSGCDSIIMSKQLDVTYHESALQALNNSQIYCQQSTPCGALPYSINSVNKIGWAESIVMQNLQTTRLDYNQYLTTDSSAKETLHDLTGTQAHQILRHKPGQLSHFFYKNCVAIGDAAGYVGNPSIDNLVMSQRMITKLLDLFPSKACLTSNQKEYNRRVAQDFQQAFDYLQIHYIWASRTHTSIPWLQHMPPMSSTLQQRTSLFKTSGRVAYDLNPLIPRQRWINLLQHCFKGEIAFDPLITSLGKNKAEDFLNQLKEAVSGHLSKFTPYQ